HDRRLDGRQREHRRARRGPRPRPRLIASMHARRTSTTALLGLALISCKGLDEGAREHFGQKYSCPEDQVEVVAQPGVKWSSVVQASRPSPEPPADVKNDPARMEKWRSDRARAAAGV